MDVSRHQIHLLVPVIRLGLLGNQELAMDKVSAFCQIVRKRSREHSEAMRRLYDLPGMMASILRQELDSMVRAIYLLNTSDRYERERLMTQTLDGEVWTVLTANGKYRNVTDREMVEVSNRLEGWTLSVYKFGCAFIHLSRFHGYSDSDPFQYISTTEQEHILRHMRYYHGGPISDRPSFEDLAMYFPSVFEKIAGNLENYLKDLESESGRGGIG